MLELTDKLGRLVLFGGDVWEVKPALVTSPYRVGVDTLPGCDKFDSLGYLSTKTDNYINACSLYYVSLGDEASHYDNLDAQ